MCSGEGLWWDHLDAQWVYKIIAQIQYVETTRNDTCIRHYFPCNRSLTKTKVQILLPWENWTSGSEIWSLWCQKWKLSCSCRLIALIHHMLVQIDSTFTSQEACRGPSREDCHDQHWGRLHPCHQAIKCMENKMTTNDVWWQPDKKFWMEFEHKVIYYSNQQ